VSLSELITSSSSIHLPEYALLQPVKMEAEVSLEKFVIIYQNATPADGG
jgi:hypothetical protein